VTPSEGKEILKRMKSKTSHQNNENFVLRTQFPVVLNIVDKTQNFHDKWIEMGKKNFRKSPATPAAACGSAR
jgi:hypothetical protein